MIAYSVAEPKNCPENWLAILSSSSPLVLIVALIISNTIAEETELDSRLSALMVLLDYKQIIKQSIGQDCLLQDTHKGS